MRRRLRPRASARVAIPVLALAAENVAIFFRHYFAGYGFPWDFLGSYYAAAAYWTEAANNGAGGVPAWMPFQSMGYPFALNPQTGLHYAPMWLFPLLRIPYTLHAAVVLQCLHVLLGALGMYLLLAAAVRSRRAALIGAFAFQLFGGFYSNAEHVDIIRAFAFAPWLFWAALPPERWETRLRRRILLLPLVVFLFATGCYPGNLLAALFLLAVFAALVLASRRLARPVLRWAAALAVAVPLGLAMAAFHLGPSWIHRGEQQRYQNFERVYRATMTPAHLPGLFAEPRRMTGDPSMNSTFVGFAVLAGVCLLSRASLARLWPWAAVGLLSAAMAAGNTLPLHALVRTLAPPLGYSRFPPSDYRILAAIALVVLGAAGWRDFRRRWRPIGRVALRLLPLCALSAWGLFQVYADQPLAGRPAWAAAALAVTLAALLFWRGLRGPAAATAVLLSAIAFDAARVLPRVDGWIVPDVLGVCRTFYPTPAAMHDAGVVVSPAVFAAPPASRPQRVTGRAEGYSAVGYLTGAYAVDDTGAAVLAAQATIAKDPGWLAFVCQPWTPIVVEGPPSAGESAEVPNLRSRTVRAAAAGVPDPRVTQTSYGADVIRYRVASPDPFLLVENEIYFPGWTSTTAGPAVRVNGLFRGWRLPAGDYDFETRFALPGAQRLRWVTAAAWVAWLAAVVSLRRRR